MVGQNVGKYRVLDRIGRGGMGTVYRAIDETLHREVAIKVLNAELNDPEVARRFRGEAITVARLSHPGIATIYELFQNEGQWLMVMEFVRGETLERMADRLGSISPQRTAELCMQTLAALAHAHSMGVVHRDLKPANIMITETGAIKVMDFGIARVAGTEHLTSAGFMMGTPAYMAPEQVMGKEIDARADLYAMGVVFYRLTTGKLPFKGETPFAMAQSQVNDPPTPVGVFRSDLPPWVEQIVVRSLAKSPEERFQSAVEFHEGFARCLAGLSMPMPYSSSAPNELMMTPPRPMPSGLMQRPVFAPAPPPTDSQATMMSNSGSHPELEPTVLSPTPLSSRVPVPPPEYPTEAETLQSGAAAVPNIVEQPLFAASGALPIAGPSGLVPLLPPIEPASPVAVVSKPGPAAAPAKGKKNSAIGLIAAAAVVVAAVGAGALWLKSRSAVTPPAETAAPVEAPLVAPVDVPPAAPEPAPAAVAPARGNAGPAVVDPSASAASAARGATPATTKPVSPVSPPLASATAAAPAAVTTAGPAVDDVTLVVRDVKLLIVNGRKTDDEDVSLSFGNGQMSLAGKKSGNIIAAMPYSSALKATYTKSRDPKWDTATFGPPQNLDVGGVLRTSKHWLVLQAKDAYLILRLEDPNFRTVLDTVGARTGLTIARPASNDKP